MNELLKLQDISKRYRKNNIDALRNISFQCAKGDVISIVGSSGSGKSTLLRIIAGLEIPDKGEITLEKNKINGSGIYLAPEKRNCSLVFQDFALFPNMSVKENIFFGKNASNNKSMIDELIEFTRIKNILERFPHEISGGQQQRVALVRALSINPALLLLDEPLSHLDHELKHQVRNELKNLIKKVGATVLMVTHDTEDAMYMANKVLVLNNGVVDQIDSPASIFNFPLNSYVARLFGKTNILPFKDFPFIDHHFFDKDLNEDVVSIRPHEFKLIDGNSSVEKPQIKGRVVSIDSLGPFLEVSIDSGKFELIVHVDRNQKIETDHDLSFYIEKK